MTADLSTEELSAWVRLSLEPGLGLAGARQLLTAIGLPQDIYASSISALSKIVPHDLARQLHRPLDSERETTLSRALQWREQPNHHVLTLSDPGYPSALLGIHDPPLLLYVNGQPNILARPVISMVGARNATIGGIDNALAFARYLSEQGWCIVSGLAQGIDAAAHEGALRAGPQGGGTVAILGTGIDIVYPPQNHDLAHRIAQHGALVSEFPLGTRALPHHFPKRNRIVAGLARGVLVVEAAKQSGSLITARLAAEMGREVFAIPGSIHSPLSRGCHALIRQGAKLVESAQDIHDELGLPRPAPPRTKANAKRSTRTKDKPDATGETEHSIVLAALGHDPVHLDALQERTQLDPGELNGQLLELELNEAVFRLDDGRFQRR